MENDKINKTDKNKEVAINFYREAFEGNPEKAVEKYVGDEYIQHNPLVNDGKAGFIEYFERMAKDYPDKSLRIVRAAAEEELVALHTHQQWPGGEEYVTMDFFRFDGQSRIVEHWDVIQKIPAQSENDNKMY